MNSFFAAVKSAVMQLFIKDNDEIKFSFSKMNIIFWHLKDDKKSLLFVFILTILTSVIILPVPIFSQRIIDTYLKLKDYRTIIILISISTILYLVNFVLNMVLSYILTIINNRLVVSIKNSLFGKIISLPISFFNRNQSSYLTSRISEVNNLNSIFTMTLVSSIISLLSFIFSLSILAYYSWKLMLITILILPIQYVIMWKLSSGMRCVSKTLLEKSANLNKDIQEVMAGINIVKSFSAEEKEKRKINASINSVAKTSIIQSILFSMAKNILGLLTQVSTLVILLTSSILIIKEQFSIGMYVASAQYINQIISYTQAFATLGITLQPVVTSVNRINEYFELFGETAHKDRKHKVMKLIGEIRFDCVSFSYGDKELLKDVSFIIHQGEKIALVGPNGSGKTTLIKLILQLELPLGGRILIDGIDLKTYDLSDIRKRIGFVSQEVFLFNDTIRNNILYGCDCIPEEELNKLTGELADFVCELPQGVDTLVGEKGMNLSGGQRQIISIIRAILKNPDILIFDEGSSNLDSNILKKLISVIEEYFRDKTCIFITHSKEIVEYVSRVFSIEKNTVKEIITIKTDNVM